MKKKSILKNYFYNLTYQIIAIILPIITAPYLARVLGAKGVGIYSYTISIVTYFVLIGNLGLTLYGQREIAFVQDNVEKRSKVFSNILALKLIFMPLSMIAFYFLFARNGLYSIYYKILLLEMFASMIDIAWFYQGLEDFKKIAIRNTLIKTLSVIAIFTFVKNPNHVIRYTIIYVISNLIGNLSLWIDLKKHITGISFKNLSLFKHIKNTFVLFIPQAAIQIYTVLDKSMIGYLIKDLYQVGYYEQSQKIIRVLLTIITSLGVVMMPRIAKCYADGEKERITKYMDKTFSFVCLLALPMIFGLLAVSKFIVPVFFGAGYDGVVPLLKITSAIILFVGFSHITGAQYLLGTKKQKEYTISVICGAVINVILNFVLIPKYKAIGACIGTISAEFIVCIIQLFFIRKEYNVISIFKNIKYLVYSIIMYIPCFLIGKILHNYSNIIILIVQVLIGFVTYLIILILVKDPLLKELFYKFKTKILKRFLKLPKKC